MIQNTIKLNFNATDLVPQTSIVCDGYIPLTLYLNYLGERPTSVYTEVYHGQNFLELWFNKTTRELYEITVVSIETKTIQFSETIVFEAPTTIYNCCVEEPTPKRHVESISVLYNASSLRLMWGKNDVRTYCITPNCIVGVDQEGCLCSVSFINLSEELITKVLAT